VRGKAGQPAVDGEVYVWTAPICGSTGLFNGHCCLSREQRRPSHQGELADANAGADQPSPGLSEVSGLLCETYAVARITG